MNFDYEGFTEFELAPRLKDHAGEVYVLVFKTRDADIPFYVGQTKRFLGRMDDYFWADFQAATDFKVGMAIQYFCDQPGGKVLVRHKLVADPGAEERKLIAQFKSSGLLLLNGSGYDYKTAAMQNELDKVHDKCREIIAHSGSSVGCSNSQLPTN